MHRGGAATTMHPMHATRPSLPAAALLCALAAGFAAASARTADHGALAQIVPVTTPAARAFLAYLPGALPPPTALPLPTSAATATRTPTATAPASATDTATATPAPPKTPGIPDCNRTTGDVGGLRLSLDGGRTVLPGARPLPMVAYTWAVVTHPSDPDDVLELHQGRVFRSRDAGCTLAEVDGVPPGEWTALDRALSDPRVWVLSSVFQPRVAYTFDDGATWEADGLPDDAVHMAIDPRDAARWSFVGRNPVRYERGAVDERWTAFPIDAVGGEQIVSASHADGPEGTAWLVGAATKGVFRSTNGVDWLPANEGLFGSVGIPPEETTAVVPAWLTLAPSDPEIGYAVVNRVARMASERGIFRTRDGGDSWTRMVVDMQDVGGVLRASVGPDNTETTFPPVTRRIESEQVQQLWRFVRDAGLLDPDHPDRIDPAPAYDVLDGRIVAIVTISRAGERHTFALALDRPTFDKGAGRTLVDRLARLAWIPE